MCSVFMCYILQGLVKQIQQLTWSKQTIVILPSQINHQDLPCLTRFRHKNHYFRQNFEGSVVNNPWSLAKNKQNESFGLSNH